MKSFFTNTRNWAIIVIVVIVAIIAGFVIHSNNTSMQDQVAKPGDHVFVNYTGTLQDGTKFDSSYDRGTPIDFILGAGQVIKGWDEGIVGMKVGDKKHLVISPEDGYGSQAITDGQGHTIIPANSTLVFDVELVKIER